MPLFVVALVACASAARADVVMPPPEVCPDGASGESCHGGEYCRPWTCVDGRRCRGETSCRDFGVCIRQFDCAGRGGPWYTDEVIGTCDNGEPCAGGECKKLLACAPPPVVVQPDATTSTDVRPGEDVRPGVDTAPAEDVRPGVDGAPSVDVPVRTDTRRVDVVTRTDTRPAVDSEDPGPGPAPTTTSERRSVACDCGVTGAGGPSWLLVAAAVAALGLVRRRR